MVCAAALVLVPGFVALINGGSTSAQPGDTCSPAAMMSAQADEMNQLANYLATHPNANSDNPADAAGALQMIAAIRNIQAGMAANCGLTMDQVMQPGTTPGQ